PGDDDVVDAGARQVLDGAVQQPHLVAAAPERPLLVEALAEHFDKMAVDLDGVEAVLRAQVAEDLRRDGAGAGADLKDGGRAERPAQFGDEGLGQEPGARQERPRVAKVPPRLAEEVSAFDPEAHPRCLVSRRRLNRQALSQTQVTYCIISQTAKGKAVKEGRL